jgi:putative peptidoglycan lipid II flippase
LVLYLGGAFGPVDTAAWALALSVYGAGLPEFVLQKVLQPLYFAREDTRRPFYYAVVSLLLNAGVAVALAPVLGFSAAAWGTTLAAWGMVAQLWLGTRRLGAVAMLDPRLRQRLPRILLASALMGAALWVYASAAAPLFAAPQLRLLALVGLLALGIVSYFGLGHALGAFRLADFRGATRRRRI